MDEASDDIATGALVQFVHGLRFSDLPQPVRQESTRALLDAVGCAVGGARHEIVDRAHTALRPFSGAPTTSILGRAEQSDPLHAVLINGLAAAAHSFFDTYSEALLHPGGTVACVLLAICERTPVNGEAFLTAFAAGVEVACRLTRMTILAPAEGNISWSQSGVVGGIAAALAAGKLLGLRPDQLRSAIGISASEAAGTRVEHGSMAASLIFGRAAQSGLRAALLAAQDFTSSPRPIEDRHGFASVFSTKPNFVAVKDGLGSRYELLQDTYKPFPTGVVVHPSIDAMLRLRREHVFNSDDIRRISLSVTPNAVTFGDRPRPKDNLEAKFSIQHWVAAAATYGKAGVAQGANAIVMDPAIIRLRSLVEVQSDPALPAHGARLTMDLNDGRQLQNMVEHCVGSAANPMSDAELETKFIEQCTPVIGELRAKELAALCWRVVALTDAADLARGGRPL